VDDRADCVELAAFFSSLHENVDEKKRRILRRYYRDLCALTNEAYRVLKYQRTATSVLCNSKIRAQEVKNSDLLISAAKQSGFRIIDRYERDIPENRRYMPFKNSSESSLSNRMRFEHVIVFEK